jgi:hypothetical protein
VHQNAKLKAPKRQTSLAKRANLLIDQRLLQRLQQRRRRRTRSKPVRNSTVNRPPRFHRRRRFLCLMKPGKRVPTAETVCVLFRWIASTWRIAWRKRVSSAIPREINLLRTYPIAREAERMFCNVKRSLTPSLGKTGLAHSWPHSGTAGSQPFRPFNRRRRNHGSRINRARPSQIHGKI